MNRRDILKSAVGAFAAPMIPLPAPPVEVPSYQSAVDVALMWRRAMEIYESELDPFEGMVLTAMKRELGVTSQGVIPADSAQL